MGEGGQGGWGAIRVQKEELGHEYLTGFRKALGDRSKRIVGEASFDLTDPTVDSQVISLKASGADTLVVFGTPKFTSLAIRKASDLGWNAIRIICSPGSSIDGALKPAGLEISTGVLSSQIVKDPDDTAFARDADVQDYLALMSKWAPQESARDSLSVTAYLAGQAVETVVRRAAGHVVVRTRE